MARSYSIALWPAAVMLLVSASSLTVSILNGKPWPGVLFAVYSAWVLLTSMVALVMFWRDKRAAILDRRRISENTLHWVAAVGGWPGSVAGQQFFRHKSSKTSFRLILWGIIGGHLLAMLLAFYLSWN